MKKIIKFIKKITLNLSLFFLRKLDKSYIIFGKDHETIVYPDYEDVEIVMGERTMTIYLTKKRTREDFIKDCIGKDVVIGSITHKIKDWSPLTSRFILSNRVGLEFDDYILLTKNKNEN